MDWVWDTFTIEVPLFDWVSFTADLVIDHLFICVVCVILGIVLLNCCVSFGICGICTVCVILGIVFLNCCVSFGLCGALSFGIMLGLWDWICLVIGGTGGDF